MSREDLHVMTVHLRELGAKHGQAAAEVALAVEAATGVGTAVRTSHGVIAQSTADALEAMLQARREAGNSLAGASRRLNENLTGAATRYESTDDGSGAYLDQQLRSDPTTPQPPR